MAQAPRLSAEPLRFAFRALDPNRSGLVKLSDLKRLLCTVGDRLSVAEFDAFRAGVYVDEQGRLSYEGAEPAAPAGTDAARVLTLAALPRAGRRGGPLSMDEIGAGNVTPGRLRICWPARDFYLPAHDHRLPAHDHHLPARATVASVA